MTGIIDGTYKRNMRLSTLMGFFFLSFVQSSVIQIWFSDAFLITTVVKSSYSSYHRCHVRSVSLDIALSPLSSASKFFPLHHSVQNPKTFICKECEKKVKCVIRVQRFVKHSNQPVLPQLKSLRSCFCFLRVWNWALLLVFALCYCHMIAWFG